MIMTPNSQRVPVKIVGSSTYGRYPTISDERTWNMYISDGWLLDFPGWRQAIQILGLESEGRGLFHSTRGNFLLIVLGARVYRIDPNLGHIEITTSTVLSTTSGEVIMDENLFSQINIVDGINSYTYNYTTGDFGRTLFQTGSDPATIDPPFVPNYVTYQNNKFIFGNGTLDTSGADWYVYNSGFNPTTLADPLLLKKNVQASIQTKPDFAKAAIRIPGHSNNLLVLGTTVAEIWTDIGGLEVYKRNSSINIDYGVASVSTIASSDEFVAWLGINEKSTPAIMVMAGGKAERISTDGIDYLLSTIQHPDQSTAVFYRQAGHLFYIITFYHPDDNLTVMHDFTTQKFFDLTDWDFTYYPVREIVYFNNKVYFASLKQGDLMEISSDITTISPNPQTDYEIPRVRKCDTFRLPGSERFIVNQFSFTIQNGAEQDVFFNYECDGYILGESSGLIMYCEDGITPILVEGGSCRVYRPKIDVTISKNGGFTYSNPVSYYMHGTGQYENKPQFNGLGMANQFTIQMRFWGLGPFVVQDGILEVYQ